MSTKFFKPVMTVCASAAACVLLPWGIVRAETPLGLSLTETLTYDSNVLRDDRKQSDLVSTTSAELSFNKDYGRQNYRASVAGIFQRYKDLNDYDNDGFELNAGVSSGLGANGSLSIDHSRSRTLQDFGDQGRLNRYREELDVQSTTVQGRYGLYGRYGLTLSGNLDKVAYDVNEEQNQNIKGLRLGVRYSPSDLLYFDFGLKKTNSEYENLVAPFVVAGVPKVNIGDKVSRYDVNVISRWEVTGLSMLTGQLGWTRERYQYDDARDFSGWTGKVIWKYTPRGQISYSLTLSRDTNNAGGYSFIDYTYAQLGFIGTGQQARQRVTTFVDARANWRITSKVSATAGLEWRRLEEEQTNVFARDTTEGTGNYRRLSAGLSYQASRALSFSCNVSSYKRDETVLATGYSGDALACAAGFTID